MRDQASLLQAQSNASSIAKQCFACPHLPLAGSATAGSSSTAIAASVAARSLLTIGVSSSAIARVATIRCLGLCVLLHGQLQAVRT